MQFFLEKEDFFWILSFQGKIDPHLQAIWHKRLFMLTAYFQKNAPKKILFDFKKLEFVGSSGMMSFLYALRDFAQTLPNPPVFCHVGKGFQLLLKRTYKDAPLPSHVFFETQENAKKAS